VLYFCTLYKRDYTFGGKQGYTGMEPACGEPQARVTVSAGSLREAAACAYIRCVGRQRVRNLRRQQVAPAKVLALQTNPRAIAASLRKTSGRMGEGYELDHVDRSWFIQVCPLPTSPRRLRLSARRLLRLCRTPFPN
jgi:hypothetical protein